MHRCYIQSITSSCCGSYTLAPLLHVMCGKTLCTLGASASVPQAEQLVWQIAYINLLYTPCFVELLSAALAKAAHCKPVQADLAHIQDLQQSTHFSAV